MVVFDLGPGAARRRQMISRRIIVVDIDHTLRDSKWRNAYAPSPVSKDVDQSHMCWDDYNELGHHDRPCAEMLYLVDQLVPPNEALYCTAIPERFRRDTQTWLDVHHLPPGRLLMRPDGETTPAPMLKPSMVIDYLRSTRGKDAVMRDHVLMVIDDRPDICEAFVALGVTCLQTRMVMRDEDPRDGS